MERTNYPGIYRAGERYRVVVTYPGGQKWATADGLKAARKLQAELRNKLDSGWRPGTITVAGYAERWLAQLAGPRDWRPARRPNTILRYHQALRLYIVPGPGEPEAL